MGHTRLGPIRKTRKWTQLVAYIAGDLGGASSNVCLADDVDAISRQAIDAAETGLKTAVNDRGLGYAFYLLTQMALAARQEQWAEALAGIGIHVDSDDSLFDLAAKAQYGIEDYLAARSAQTDISEMAQAALGEALTRVAGSESETLFGSGIEDVRIAMQKTSTRKGFSTLGQAFFSAFLERFLNYHVSRITASHTGLARLPQVGQLTRFNDALKLHCDQTAVIVGDFCGQWYSKTEFQQGITPRNAASFVAVAVQKLRSELHHQGENP